MYIWELGVTFFSYSVMKLYYLFLEAVKKTHLQKYQDPMSVSTIGQQIYCVNWFNVFTFFYFYTSYWEYYGNMFFKIINISFCFEFYYYF